MTGEAEQLQVQLAGCGVAALGGTSDPVIAKRGDYGWSQSYQDVLELRRKYEVLLRASRRALACLDDPTGGEHVEEMRSAARHLRLGIPQEFLELGAPPSEPVNVAAG